MSSEADGNRWDPYCPCKATSKNMVIIGSGKNFLEFLNEQIHLKLIFYILLYILGIVCLALVAIVLCFLLDPTSVEMKPGDILKFI